MKKHEIEKPPTFTKIKEGWIVGDYQADSTKYEVVAIPVPKGFGAQTHGSTSNTHDCWLVWESIGYRARMMMKAGMGDPAYVNDKLTGTLKRKVDQENTETPIRALAEALRNPGAIPVVED